MSKFEVGDKVKIIKECNCHHWELCVSTYYNQSGRIIGIENNKCQVRVNQYHFCNFTEEQLELVERPDKEIKVYGIVSFIKENYK